MSLTPPHISPVSGRTTVLPDTSQKQLGKSYKYGCALALIPEPYASQIQGWARDVIWDSHLGPGGREDETHVTVKYGFTDDDEATYLAVRALLVRHGPILVRFASVSVFPDSGDGVVLKIDIESPELHELHEELSSLPNADKWPEYRPHVTVAYLDPVFAQGYALYAPPFLGDEIYLDTVKWSPAGGGPKKLIHLSGRNSLEASGKAMSWVSSPAGGALVKPPKFMGPRARRPVPPSARKYVKSGFTGERTDSANRKRCYRDGHLVPCAQGGAAGEEELQRQEEAGVRRSQRVERGDSRRAAREARQRFWGGPGGQAIRAAGGVSGALKKGAALVGMHVWNSLPTRAKKAVGIASTVGAHVEHVLDGISTGSQKLVEKVARARGLDRVQAKKLRRWCTLADGIARWTANIPASHHGIEQLMHGLGMPDMEFTEQLVPDNVPVVGGLKVTGAFLGAKLGYYVPVGSLAFLGYSTARNPVKTMKAAWDFFRPAQAGHGGSAHGREGLFQKIKKIVQAKPEDLEWKAQEGAGVKAVTGQDELEQVMGLLADAVKEHSSGDAQKDGWFDAVFSAALDATHDVERALEVVRLVLGEFPQEPPTDDVQMADWLPGFGGRDDEKTQPAAG